jgi:hypothetical protein
MDDRSGGRDEQSSAPGLAAPGILRYIHGVFETPFPHHARQLEGEGFSFG